MSAQKNLFKVARSEHGGERQRRHSARPIHTRRNMHLILKSSRARGDWSFSSPQNRQKTNEILEKFSRKHGVRVLDRADAGNHIHLTIQIKNRFLYRPFIQALTSALMMAITGTSRWSKPLGAKKFWDHRPYSRIVAAGKKAFETLRDYLEINRLQGRGRTREEAEFEVYSAAARRLKRELAPA